MLSVFGKIKKITKLSDVRVNIDYRLVFTYEVNNSLKEDTVFHINCETNLELFFRLRFLLNSVQSVKLKVTFFYF